MNSFPKRIVSLSPDSSDILFRLGVGDSIVGVSAFAEVPMPHKKIQRVSGFDSVNIKKVVSLQPDLVIAYSDVQQKFAEDLKREGLNVIHTFQTSLDEIAEVIRLFGRTVGKSEAAEALIQRFHNEMRPQVVSKRVTAYFEEWDKPMISGIGWVGEMIELAGGTDIFSEKRKCKKAVERTVSADEVIRRNPDIILFSWCGKKGTLEEIKNRPGWEKISAVQKDQIFEMESSKILQPSPILMEGFAILRSIFQGRIG
jgi:iron complex transport system substrate-binding protein